MTILMVPALEWIVERAEGEKRRPTRRPSDGTDPRELLRAVK